MTAKEIQAVEKPWYEAAKLAMELLKESVTSNNMEDRQASERRRTADMARLQHVAHPTYPHTCDGHVGSDCQAWHVVPK
jgi:hypothetical protein